MNRPNPFNIATLAHVSGLISGSPLRLGFPAVLLVLGCFALLAAARAQLPSPTPDGGYPGNNTAEGDGALSSVQYTGYGAENTAIGFNALTSNTSGNDNTAIGAGALASNTTGSENTATGAGALASNTTGNGNTTVGDAALLMNNADNNTATGIEALLFNTTGEANTASGAFALFHNTRGSSNTATGYSALHSNDADNNTANGANALFSNTTGIDNTANGTNALFSNTTGIDNTATGAFALVFNSVGNYNTANGLNALVHNTSGGANTAIGVSALFRNETGSKNTAIGTLALENNNTGDNNIALGFNAGANLTTSSNNIDIANVGIAGESNTIRIGTIGTQTNTFVAGISGVAVTGVAVHVSSSGQLGVKPSSARFKEAIKPMDKASETILALKPVTFRYTHDLDPDCIPQFGLIAEEVEKVNADLVVRDEQGKAMTVRYEAVNAMLLNEFLKEHCKMEEQAATIAQMKKQIESLTAGLQKVTDQIEANKTAPHLVAND